jgi:hypothetical protein
MELKLYQHFKGGLYVVTGESSQNVTNGEPTGLISKMVTYYRCSDGGSFARQFDEFHENVEHEGKTGPRFRFIADSADIMPNGGHP